MTEAQVQRVVDELMDKMFWDIERDEREIARDMERQANSKTETTPTLPNNPQT